MTYTQFTYTVPEITKTELLNRTGIYKIVNTENGKFYIGSTSISFISRWQLHISQLKNNTHHSQYLQNAWNKYGELAFNFEIVEIVPPNECIETEQLYLDYCDFNFTYNICKVAGSQLGLKRSQETKNKIKESKNGKNYFFHKLSNKYEIQFRINNKQYYFGSYSDENECIEKVDFLRTLSDEQKIEYWNDNFNRKLNTRGYSFHKTSNSYRIQLIIDGRLNSFGYFKTEDEAINKVSQIRAIL